MTPSPARSSGPGLEADEAPLEVLRRRLLSHGALALAGILWLAGLPIWVVLAAVADLLRAAMGDRRFALLRSVAAFGLVLGAEGAGVCLAYGMTLRRALFGMDEPAWRSWHYMLQRRWGGVLVEGARRIYGFRIEVEGAEQLDGRPVLLFMRHASVADGVLLLPLVNTARGYRLRYVVKRELLLDPCLDVVGHRIPNVFVRREGGDASREVARVEALARGLGRGEGLMLFPEGTRFTPARKARALERLAAEGPPELRRLGESLRHCLPPRPGGALGAMRGAPGVMVALCALTGLEGVTRLGDLVGGALVGGVLRMRVWVTPAEALPEGDEARYRWLMERWVELDAWVCAQLTG